MNQVWPHYLTPFVEAVIKVQLISEKKHKHAILLHVDRPTWIDGLRSDRVLPFIAQIGSMGVERGV